MNQVNHHNPDSSHMPSTGRVLQTDGFHCSVRQSLNATVVTRGKINVKEAENRGWVRNYRVAEEVLRGLRLYHSTGFN